MTDQQLAFFISAVKDLRSAQKNDLKLRSSLALSLTRKREKTVDDLLAKLDVEGKTEEQGTIF